MTPSIYDVLIDVIALIEFSDEDAIELDYAVKMLEAATSYMHLLSAEDRAALVRRARERAAETNDPREKEFLAAFGSSLDGG